MKVMSAKIYAHHYTGKFEEGVVFENSITVDVSVFENGMYDHTVTARRKFVDKDGKLVAVEWGMPKINVEKFQDALDAIQGTRAYVVLTEDQSAENLPRFISSYGIILRSGEKERMYSVPFTDNATARLFVHTNLTKLKEMSNREIISQINWDE